MTRTAQVVIIGGGIVGSSIAYQLTKAGCRDVVILERESHQGKGSTGKSMGGVRAQFSTPTSIQMSLYSIPFFRDFEQTLGHPSGYRAQGYLLLATNERQLGYLRTNVEIQIAAGLKTVSLVTKDDIVRLVPQLRADDIVGGTFCSTDGFVDPYSVMTGFTLRAVDQGAQVFRDAAVTGIDRDSNGIAAVHSTARLVRHAHCRQCIGRLVSADRENGRPRFTGGAAAPNAGPHRSRSKKFRTAHR